MIKAIVIDCDGVLTDGKMYIDHTGDKMFKAFNSRDIRAIRELVGQGIDVVVMTADDWPGTIAWCSRVGCRFVCTRDKHAACIEQGFEPEHTLVVGDDAWDVKAMAWARLRACPRDAHHSVFRLFGVIRLEAVGGDGVIAALVDHLYGRGGLGCA